MTSNWLDFSRYAVWGLGRSGKAAANLLARHGKQVIASDVRPADELEDDVADLEDTVEWTGGKNVIGDAEVVVTSPGLRPGLEVFDRARQQGLPVISEVDLAYDVSDSATWIGITGTDGKTTTTGMVGSILEAAGREHVVAGNIGTALCDVVEQLDENGIIVAELSANQLWSCHHLSVDIAAITNIAEDHLDYFDDFREYPAAKYRLVRLQNLDDATVLPVGHEQLASALGEHSQANLRWFGRGSRAAQKGGRVVYFDDDGVGRWQRGSQTGVWVENFAQTGLLGQHNQLNAACAAAIARSVDVSWKACAAGLVQFEPPQHRMQPVADIDGVTYIDDSKATNAHASLAGLAGIEPPLVVIAGGRDKGLDLAEWSRQVAERAELVVVIGEIRQRMTELLEQQGGDVTTADELRDAVETAKKHARPGSTVVLSPACSSYDMFSSYRERGRLFQKAVSQLSSRSS